jgi:micrococcal nuclease
MKISRSLGSQIALLMGCLIAGILFVVDKPTPELSVIAPIAVNTREKPLPEGSYRVIKTTDGDTIDVEVAGKSQRVRLLGVDTPETKDPRKPVQCFGKEASTYTKRMLENTIVRLEVDPTQDATDMYGRWLRYVFLPDGTNFNEQLIAQGYAYEYTFKKPGQYQTALKQAESTARNERRGLWAPDACNKK